MVREQIGPVAIWSSLQGRQQADEHDQGALSVDRPWKGCDKKMTQEQKGKKQEEKLDKENQFDEENLKKKKGMWMLYFTFAEGGGLLQAIERVGLPRRREGRAGRVGFDTE